MSGGLFRLGQFAYCRHRLVCAVWLLALAVAIGTAIGAGGKINNEFNVPGTESQNATNLLKQTFPEASGAASQIVFAAPDGKSLDDADLRDAIGRVVDSASRAPQVAVVYSPFDAQTVTLDGRTAFAPVQYSVTAGEIQLSSLDKLQETRGAASGSNLRIEYGGEAFQSNPAVGASEAIGVLIAFVILAVALGSVFVGTIPLFTALFGLGVSMSLVLAFSSVVTMSSAAPLLAVMIGLAVGIDYALFIIARYRNELAANGDRELAAARAVATAGSAVVFAGVTVFVALAAMAVVRVPFLTVMGLSSSVTVVVAVLVAITLLPALLAFAGKRVPAKPLADAEGEGARWYRVISRKPALTVVAVIAVLGVIALPAHELQLALPDNGSAPHESTQRQAYELIDAGFGPGFNGPLFVVIDHRGVPDPTAAVTRIADELRRIPGIVFVAQPQPSASGTVTLVQAVPATAPDDRETKDVVDRVRGEESTWSEETGANVAVTGYTASGIDVSKRLSETVIPFAAIVVGLAFLVLFVVFRSLIVPIKAAAGFLLSAAAAFGATVAVFQWGWLQDVFAVTPNDATVNFLPVILLAVLFGLAMDYEVFLLSRMREDFVDNGNAIQAVRSGWSLSARVVTAAALIMFTVFASFITNEDIGVKAIAFALTVGILLDAFVVRMALVPAVMLLLKERAWWLPASLAKVLPEIDIEGSRLAVNVSKESHDDVVDLTVPQHVVVLRRALRRALHDLGINAREVHVRCKVIEGDVQVQLSGAVATTVTQGRHDSEEPMALRFAESVQGVLGEDAPSCPGHIHTPVPVLTRDRARWQCPDDANTLGTPIGLFALDLREQRSSSG